MGSVFAALSAVGNTLSLYNQALAADQSNIANASTPGYAVQNVSIVAGQVGAGIDTIALRAPDATSADAAVRAASSQSSFDQTTTSQLTPVNGLFDITGSSGILAALQKFGSAFSALSGNPNDPTLGADALAAAGTVAQSFNSTAQSLVSQRSQVDAALQDVAGQINTLAGTVATLNGKIASGSAPQSSAGAQLRSALDQLSSLTDINVNWHSDGTVSVLAGAQVPLVLGSQAYSITVNPGASAGSQVVSSAGGSSPAEFGGQLGALLDVRNNVFGQLLGANGSPGSLNQLASGFAGSVNSLLTSGLTASGAAGVPIFKWDQSNPANAAVTLSVDPTVVPSQLGLASSGTGGTANGIANQLAELPGSTAAPNIAAGSSAVGLFGAMAASVGQQLSDSQAAVSADQAALTSVQNDRQNLIGVSFDQEAVNITSEQRAYQANAEVMTILNQIAQSTMDIVK